MAHSQNDQYTFRDYLLGKLRGEDLKSFEERLITDREDFEELLAAAEDDLTDEYVAGQLSKDERDAFERHYLITPERHADIDFARTLNRYLQKRRQFTPPIVQPENEVMAGLNLTWVLRAAIAVVVFGVIAIPIYRSLRQPHVATIILNPSVVTRGDAAPDNRVDLGDADTLTLLLNVPAQAASGVKYRAELEYLEDNTGASQAAGVTNQNSQTVTIEIPTDGLRKGRYAVRLFVSPSGHPDQQAATYNFTVQ